MNSSLNVLYRCRCAGLRLWRKGERIGFSPASRCPADLRVEIRAHKQDLFDLLEAEAAGLERDCAPWLHVARRVLAGEFNDGDQSLLTSLHIGVRHINHPVCQSAKMRLETLLNRLKETRK